MKIVGTLPKGANNIFNMLILFLLNKIRIFNYALNFGYCNEVKPVDSEI
jgi:hypothetical protein